MVSRNRHRVNLILWRASWRFFRHHPWQLGLTLLSIALGTAVMVGVDIANQSAKASFQHSITALSGDMTHEITAPQDQTARLSAEMYRRLRVEWGYDQSAPQLQATVSSQGLQYTLLGIDAFALSPKQSAGITITTSQIIQLMTSANGVAISTNLAQRLALKVGDTLPVAYQQRSLILTIMALLPSSSMDNVLLADIGVAQALLQENTLSRIVLRLNDTEAQALKQQLPPALRLQSFTQQQAVFGQMSRAFDTNLTAMSLLAVLIGAFLVYNTMTFAVLQRQAIFAIERMLGVTRQQLLHHLILEASLLGLLGSLLGAGLGIILGQGLLVVITQTVPDLYIDATWYELWLTPWQLIKGIGISLGAVMVATALPILTAAKISPLLAQRRSSQEQRHQSFVWYLLALGVMALITSVLLLPLSAKALWWGFIVLFIGVVGYSLLLPLVLRIVLQLMPYFLPANALLIRLAIRSIQASLSRISLAIIALMVAVAATVGVSIMIGSFRSSVEDWLAVTLQSDLYVSAINEQGSKVSGDLNPEWVTRLQTLPAVISLNPIRRVSLLSDRRAIEAMIMPATARNARGFSFFNANGQALPETEQQRIWQDFVQGEGVLVSEPFAFHEAVAPKDTFALMTDTAGRKAFTVLGVFRDYSSTQGTLILPQAVYQQYWQDRALSSVGLVLHPKADLAAIQTQLQQWAATLALPNQPLVVRSNAEIRARSLQIFDRTFSIMHVLRILVIIVAFIGVFSALMALFLERKREFSILRAIGITPQQLQFLVIIQALLMGLLAGLLSLPLGWIMSDILIDTINRRAFGWSMQHYFAIGQFVQAVMLAVFAALLASWYPVWRMAKLSIRQGLQA